MVSCTNNGEAYTWGRARPPPEQEAPVTEEARPPPGCRHAVLAELPEGRPLRPFPAEKIVPKCFLTRSDRNGMCVPVEWQRAMGKRGRGEEAGSGGHLPAVRAVKSDRTGIYSCRNVDNHEHSGYWTFTSTFGAVHGVGDSVAPFAA